MLSIASKTRKPYPKTSGSLPARIRYGRLSIFALSVLLSGCAAVWHQPGIPRPQMEQDLGHCEAQADQQIPARMAQVQISAGYWTPATQQCWRSYGGYTCQQYPAQWNPPQFAEQDLNALLRHQRVRNCMHQLGFRR